MRACNLVIMDAGPLIKLAIADQLDLLLNFQRKIFIPDEVYFEAFEKFAWENQTPLTPDKIRLKEWVEAQEAAGRAKRADTWIGEKAKADRDSGKYKPELKNHPRHLGETAAMSFFLNRDLEGFGNEPALVLVDDKPAIDAIKIGGEDMYILTTYAMLIAMEEERLIPSAERVWDAILVGIPTADKANNPDPSGSIRGDTEFRSILKNPETPTLAMFEEKAPTSRSQ